MADLLRPEDVAGHRFKSGWRGYEADDVDRFLHEVAATIKTLAEENEALREQLRALGYRDMHAEFEQVSAEIAGLLRQARETAEGIRSRAALHAEQTRADADADAVKLRTDAWEAGTELLESAQSEAAAIVAAAEKQSLAIIGEAEREAHRRTAAARKDADELLRQARSEADRLIVDARARHAEMIEEGKAQVEAAESKTEALAARREELLSELESVRETIRNMEAEIEERRAAIDKVRNVSTSTVKVLPPDREKEDQPQATGEWSSGGEAVKIVPAPKRIRPSSAVVDADEIAAEVRKLRRPSDSDEATQEQPATEPQPAPEPETPKPEPEAVSGPETPEPEAASPPESESISESQPQTPEPGAEPESEPLPEPVPEAIDDLFARLRAEVTGAPSPVAEPEAVSEPEPELEPPAEPEPVSPRHVEAVDADEVFELRDRLLLPVINKALRTIKRDLTEAQNVALDELRVKEADWGPDPEELAAMIADDLTELVQRAIGAGFDAAGRFTGSDVGDHTIEVVESDAADVFAGDLSLAAAEAVDAAGEGPRRRAAALSRVYRAWRVDEAERRVHELAMDAFHDGLVEGLREAGVEHVRWAVAGRGCATCREFAERGAVPIDDAELPPAHHGCRCTLVPA